MTRMTSCRQSGNQDHVRDEDVDDEAVAGRRSKDAAGVDLDAVLDDISSTLESNAEEYVNGFVQQGGQ